jgi:hypothetical protein
MFEVLPPNIKTLVITDDLYMTKGFRGQFDDDQAMQMLERYLEKDLTRATPQLERFTYDMRERGHRTRGYWNVARSRKDFISLCYEHGVEGKVLWDDSVRPFKDQLSLGWRESLKGQAEQVILLSCTFAYGLPSVPYYL